MPLTLPQPLHRKRGKGQPVNLLPSSRGARPCTLRSGSGSGTSSLRNDLRRAGASCLRRRSRGEGGGLGGSRRGSPGHSRWRGPACLGRSCCLVRLGCRSRNGSYAGTTALNLLEDCVRDRASTRSWSPEPRYSLVSLLDMGDGMGERLGGLPVKFGSLFALTLAKRAAMLTGGAGGIIADCESGTVRVFFSVDGIVKLGFVSTTRVQVSARMVAQGLICRVPLYHIARVPRKTSPSRWPVRPSECEPLWSRKPHQPILSILSRGAGPGQSS
jgi:hypothetical protein